MKKTYEENLYDLIKLNREKLSSDLYLLASQISFLQEKITLNNAPNDIHTIKMAQKNLEDKIERHTQLLSEYREELYRMKSDSKLLMSSLSSIEHSINESLKSINKRLEDIRDIAVQAEKQNISQHSNLTNLDKRITRIDEDSKSRMDSYVKYMWGLALVVISSVIAHLLK